MVVGDILIDPERLLDATPDAILLVDAKGKIRLINRQAELLFSYPREELLNAEIEILIPTTLHRKHKTLRENFNVSPHVRPMGVGLELHAVDKNGRKFPVEISLSPYEQGGLPYTIAVIRDVTTLRHAERELRKRTKEVERSNQDLQEFAAIASHDLQAPLRQLISYCQILNEEFEGPLGEIGGGYTKVIQNAAARMQSQITSLLEYAKVGSDAPRQISVDLNDVVGEVSVRLAAEIDNAGLRIRIPEPLPILLGDRQAFLQVFQNLIENSLKFAKPGVPPIIEILCERDPSSWTITIADNGIGIPVQEHKTVFDIFQRGRNHTAGNGAGIGLAICKKLIERLDGKIWVADDYSDGTKVCFLVPARRASD